MASAALILAITAAASPVVFHTDFSGDATGRYTRTEAAHDFAQPKWSDGLDEGLAEIVPADCGKALRVHYPAGVTGGGVIIPVALPQAYEALYLSYAVRFPDGFAFVKEGKLSGLCGGTCNSGGHRANGKDGWSSRVIWRGDKAAQYVYAADQAGDYGDIAVWSDEHNRLTTGVWHRVQTYVHLNTPGKADGVIISWLDGHEAYRNDHMRFRDVDGLGIDSFRFETFFGGSTPDFAPPSAQFADFADISVSTEPVAPGACRLIR